ncbi:MAG: hypothetical protein PW790_14450 [Parvibaculaceae bacterium]|nr:hypothetical protein [Parvibaculaceae bacterium]
MASGPIPPMAAPFAANAARPISPFASEGAGRRSPDGRFFVPDMNAASEESGFCIQARARPSAFDAPRPALFGQNARFVPVDSSMAELFSRHFPQAGTPAAAAAAFVRKAREQRLASRVFRRRHKNGEGGEEDQVWEIPDLPALSVRLIRRIWQLLQLLGEKKFNRRITHDLADGLRADLEALVAALPGPELMAALFPQGRSPVSGLSPRIGGIMECFETVRAEAADIEKILFLLSDMVNIGHAGVKKPLRDSFAALARRMHCALKAGFHELIALDKAWCAAMRA